MVKLYGETRAFLWNYGGFDAYIGGQHYQLATVVTEAELGVIPLEKEVQGYIHNLKTRPVWYGDKPVDNIQLSGVMYRSRPIERFRPQPFVWNRGPYWDEYDSDLNWYRIDTGPVGYGKILIPTWSLYDLRTPHEVAGMAYTNHTCDLTAIVVDSIDGYKITFRRAGVHQGRPGDAIKQLATEAPIVFDASKSFNNSWYKMEPIPGPVYSPWTGALTGAEADTIEKLATFGVPPINKGELCYEAVQGTRAININTLMYCAELLELGKLVRGTLDTLMGSKNIRSVKQALASASDLYLSYHYGYRLSYKDTVTLYDAARREYHELWRTRPGAIRSKMNSQGRCATPSLNGLVYHCTDTCKIWYDQLDHGFEALLNQLFRWDIFPEIGNAYDMVPFSFVLDWFLPLGDVIDRIDNHTYAYTLDVHSVFYSRKLIVSGVREDVPFVQGLFKGYSTWGLDLSIYHRWAEPELSFPILELHPQAGPKNWLPAGALICQGLGRT